VTVGAITGGGSHKRENKLAANNTAAIINAMNCQRNPRSIITP
jgi:hypothetical protein